MRFIILLLILLSIYSITGAQTPYSIYVIVFDENGILEPDVLVTFIHNDKSYILNTVYDGSVVFSTMNFDIKNGDKIKIETKYGTKKVKIDRRFSSSGVIYNDPGSGTDIFVALGFVVISAGGGVYYLIRRKK
jgi:LPXTG-motif cell wall-anchored protein